MCALPSKFADWFDARGWSAHPHQLDLIARAEQPAQLLIAPTGGGKTLAGFLPSLIEMDAERPDHLHTLYISPLRALASDIRRNLAAPVEELGLDIRVEDRTGDTRQAQRQRQRTDPPHILLTTPESLALLLSYPEAPRIFGKLRRVIVDEIHALAESKRGDQLMLGLARLQSLSPYLKRVGLSATVENPGELGNFLAPNACEILEADPGPDPEIGMLETLSLPPWSSGNGRYAVEEVYAEVKAHKITLIFINTRALAELFFQALWSANVDDLPIGLHHGSLSREARERVEAAMVAGDLRAIVCTGSLDLGIDWGDVDLVIQIGAPKNVKRLVQRIGRANHRYNAPSRALIVPANRFEVIECIAAMQAVLERDLDGEPRGPGPLDVLCQHIMLTACSAPFDPGALFEEVRLAGPYHALTPAEFDRCLDFCATGGYALRAYDKWKRLVERDGKYQLRDPRTERALRMNIGTIVDTETLKVRKGRRGGPLLGEVEEMFAASLTPGETFLIGGQVVQYDGLREMTVMVSDAGKREPRVAVFSGSRLSMSTRLSHRVLDILNNQDSWHALPAHTQSWLHTQSQISMQPPHNGLLTESYMRDGTACFCIYGFAGRNAHQTLGLLLTHRMEEAGLNPLGFVANDYAVLVWGLDEVTDPEPLLSPDNLRDGLDTWLKGNAVMKKTFRNAATVACLIERNLPGQRKSGRQATFSSDILYDTLTKYDPDHLMLEITRTEAMRGLVDFERIEEMLARAEGAHTHIRAPHITPLSAPLLMEVGKVPIKGQAREQLMADAAEAMMREAGLAQAS